MNLKKGTIYFPVSRNDKPVHYLCICAHPDDAEIMAVDGILKGYYSSSSSFALVVLTDGAGSSRSGEYKDFTDEMMIEERRKEQQKAAEIGHYHSLYMLNYSSKEVKDKANKDIEEEIKEIIKELKPSVIYTHSILDKHPTHLACARKVIETLRELDKEHLPQQLYGMEVWRGLDWIKDERKIGFDVSNNPELQEELLDVFASQIASGKGYKEASIGRRYQNATYYQSHSLDRSKMMTYGIDLLPLINNPSLSIKEYALSFVEDLKEEIIEAYK